MSIALDKEKNNMDQYKNIPDMIKNEFEKPEQPDYQGVVSSLNKEHNLSDDKGFKLAKTDDPAYKGVNILHPTGRGMTPNELDWAIKNKSLKGYQENANAREEAMRKSLGETDKPQPQLDQAKQIIRKWGYDPEQKFTNEQFMV